MVLTKVCEMCGLEYETKAHHAKYCPECRPEVQRERLRVQYKRTYKHNREQVRNKSPDPLAIEQGWMNLAWAMVEQAFKDHDLDWLRENGRIWLIFSGRNIGKHNFTQLLEEIVYAKEKKEKTGKVHKPPQENT